jgi:hypothetical protein
MKRFISFLVLGLAVAFGLQAAAVAQETSRTITISRDLKVGDVTLEKGQYTLKFVEGQEGEVIFARGKRDVLKATFTVMNLEKNPADNMVISSLATGGAYTLKRIEFKGRNAALAFDNTVAKALEK